MPLRFFDRRLLDRGSRHRKDEENRRSNTAATITKTLGAFLSRVSPFCLAGGRCLQDADEASREVPARTADLRAARSSAGLSLAQATRWDGPRSSGVIDVCQGDDRSHPGDLVTGEAVRVAVPSCHSWWCLTAEWY